jgi:Na+-transporting NADH:ubiquinone oxidoreductase subunit NqrB
LYSLKKEAMATRFSSVDSRYFQITGQLTFLLTGIVFLGWDEYIFSFAVVIFSCFLFQTLAIKYLALPDSSSLRSSLITSLGLCLLLRVSDPFIMVTAAALAIGQKFLFRWKGYHFWNPANFAMVVLIAFSDEAWVSPGQWGHFLAIPLFIVVIGSLVLRNAQRWDMAVVFGLTLAALCFMRFVLYQGWNIEVWWHQFNTGTFWLYALFMITDPMTTPQNRTARLIWAAALGGIAFYVQHLMFIPTAPVWVLFFMTPMVPLINYGMKSEKWNWQLNFKSSTI